MMDVLTIQLVGACCPSCSSMNWVNNGDVQDLSGCDIEAITCWSCGESFWLIEPAEVEVRYGEDAQAKGMADEGKPTAKDVA